MYDYHEFIINKVKDEGHDYEKYNKSTLVKALAELLGDPDREEIKSIFKKELDLLSSPKSIEFALDALELVPRYFWYSNLVSEYDEEYDDIYVFGGLVMHTKLVVKIANALCDDYGANDTLRDIVIISALLHDNYIMGRSELVTNDYDVDPLHPLYVRLSLQDNNLDEGIPSAVWVGIMDCIEEHMGSAAVTPKLTTKPGTPAYLLHLADYLSSIDSLFSC